MRVGVYLPGLPAEIGGGHTFEEEILLSLERMQTNGSKRHEFVALRDGPTPSAAVLETVSVASLRLQSARTKLGRALRQRAMELTGRFRFGWLQDPVERLLQRHGIELMYYPTEAPLTLELPYIITVWDLEHRVQPYFPELSANGIWHRRETHFARRLRRAARVITGTRVGQAQIERYYQVPPERICCLPHPTPTFALHAPEVDVSAVLAHHQIRSPYLLFPAQFWAHKNHVTLLHVLRTLHREHAADFSVVFVGSDQGNQAHVYRQTSELGLADRVHFLGFVPRRDLVALYRGAFALMYLTFFGPENLPPLEAFALGCPVIASNILGASEQLGDAALLVSPADEQLAAAAVLRLRDQPLLRATLVERGRTRARRFTGDDFTRGVLHVIDDLAPLRRCWAV